MGTCRRCRRPFHYGWGANASFAVALWLLGRLSGAPLRGLGLICRHDLLERWPPAGLVCIVFGEATSIPFLQMPAYIIAAAGRLRGDRDARHPGLDRTPHPGDVRGTVVRGGRALSLSWLYSVAQVMLLGAPVSGTAQAVVAAWFASNVVQPVAPPDRLARLLPRAEAHRPHDQQLSLRAARLLDAALLRGMTGGRHLIGGPVPLGFPRWTRVLLARAVPLPGISLNLREGLTGAAAAMSWFHFARPAGLFGGRDRRRGLLLPGFRPVIQFTYFPVAQLKLALLGALLAADLRRHLLPGAAHHGVAWPSRP